ncbi:hypothetical protein AAP_05690 [Ascosphaera apis ARSEF 7405]|uniref:Uncharacterized protein n=1 Tax=Ascosphaera apis ARSEF 7405 TaxID=392613 RepID=A0A167VFH6_9EURO|nr:hypothetical protein AAP_05690 [Ascosphaera apis ARSEF 7405]
MSNYTNIEELDGASSFVLENDGFSPVSAPLSDQPGSPFPPSSPPLAQSSPVDDNSYPRNVDSLDGLTFSSYNDGEAYIAQRAEDADFAIVKRRSRNHCLTTPGGYRYHNIECYMARFSESKAQSDRHSTAVRCGCPWKGTFQYCDGLWRARAVDIAKQVSKEINVTVTPKDVQNICDAESVKSRENFTATQCFFRELRRDEDCIVEYKLDERNRPVQHVQDQLLRTPSHGDHWLEYHVQRRVVSHEREESRRLSMGTVSFNVDHIHLCVWHIQKNVRFNIAKKWDGSLEGTYLGSLIGERGSQIRDNDAAGNQRRSAARTQSNPSSSNDLTASARSTADISRRWENDADGCLDAWNTVVHALTKDESDAAWDQMKIEFRTQKAILDYLDSTYIVRRDLFADYATKQIQNFVTSVEFTRQSRVLLRAIKDTLTQQRDTYFRRFNAERGKNIVECRDTPIFRDLRRKVSHAAFKIMLEQWHIAKEALERSSGAVNMACTETFMRQHGLPCWHFMYAQHTMFQNRAVITLRMVHMHWHLWKVELPPEEALLRSIQDPAIRPLRGMRKRRERLRSHDEMRERRVRHRPALQTIAEEEELHDAPEVLVPGTQPEEAVAEEVIDLTGKESEGGAEHGEDESLEDYVTRLIVRMRQRQREVREHEERMDNLAAGMPEMTPRRPRGVSTCSSCSQLGHTRRSKRYPNYATSSALN